ncbi:hypothetical protein ABT246_01665 [Streptomyces sp. NPDC001553]|uniref:hypothetical protein n=1 Tax=Streptomyces sp. NPDC001553 TaxID=3154385 RepID=UPI00333346A3
MAHKRFLPAAAAVLFLVISCGSQGEGTNNPPSPNSSPSATPPGSSARPGESGNPGSKGEALFTKSATLEDIDKTYAGRDFFVSVGKDGVVTHAANGKEVARSGIAGFAGGCVLDVIGSSPDAGSLIWAQVTDKPAAGLEPASRSLSIVATDTKTYKERWRKPLVADTDEFAGCQYAQEATATKNEKWLTYGEWVISLTDGTSRALGYGIRPRAVGNTVLVYDGVCANCLNGMDSVPVTDPATGRELFSFPDHDIIGSLSDVPGDFATSSDGSTLFLARRISGDPISYALQSRSLTTGKVNWEITGTSYTGPASRKVTLVEKAGVVVIPDLAAVKQEVAPEVQKDLGVSMADGKKLWSLPGIDVCAANAAGVAVVANGQLVVIDPRTGKQISYTDERSDCGVPLGEYSFYSKDGALIRVLPSTE